MGVLFLPATVVAAWLLAIFGVPPIGADPGDDFSVTAMRWMMFMSGGIMFLISGIMHTVLAKGTAKNIGWQTNGFQYELGFVSLGIGAAGVVAAPMGANAWLVMSIVISVFLLGAAANHIVEMFKEQNYSPGNTLVLLYDLGFPISLWALLISIGAL